METTDFARGIADDVYRTHVAKKALLARNIYDSSTQKVESVIPGVTKPLKVGERVVNGVANIADDNVKSLLATGEDGVEKRNGILKRIKWNRGGIV